MTRKPRRGPAAPRMPLFVIALVAVAGIALLGACSDAVGPNASSLIPTPPSATIVSVPGVYDDFDATTIDWSTVEFGPDGATEAHGRGHVEDVDHDGDADMVFHFRTGETGLACGDTEATLTGRTTGGADFIGTDAIRTICGGRGR